MLEIENRVWVKNFNFFDKKILLFLAISSSLIYFGSHPSTYLYIYEVDVMTRWDGWMGGRERDSLKPISSLLKHFDHVVENFCHCRCCTKITARFWTKKAFGYQ